MENKKHRMMRMFLTPISRFSILLIGFYSFMFGLWVANPYTDSFGRSPIYSVLDWYGSEVGWGVAHIIIGLVVMAASFDSLKFMKYATFLGFLLWTLVTIGFAASDFVNPGMWIAGYIAAQHAHMFLNVNARDN